MSKKQFLTSSTILQAWNSFSSESLLEFLVEILKKNILIRKDDDIQYMIKSTSNLTFFNVLDNETHYFCCRYLKYEYAPKGKIIVRQSNSKNKINSKADLESKLYVLLKGKCGIYKLEDKPQTFQELFTPKRRNSQKPRKTLIEPDADMITEMPVKKSDKPEFVLNVDFGQERNILEYLDFPKNQNKAIFPFTFKNIPFMTRMNKLNKLFNTELVFVKNFEDEDIFCQTSLFGTVFQSSMIIAEEDCHLAVLEKEFFNQVIKKYEEWKINEDLEFLYKYKPWNLYSYSQIKQIHGLLLNKRILKDEYVYREYDKSEDLFFIRDGDFEVSKVISIKEEKRSNELDLDKKFIGPQSTLLRKIEVDLFILKKGESFGDIEIHKKIPRMFNIKCISSIGEIYILKKEHFEKLMLPNNHYKEYIKEKIDNIQKLYKNRVDQADSIYSKHQNLILPSKLLYTQKDKTDNPMKFLQPPKSPQDFDIRAFRHSKSSQMYRKSKSVDEKRINPTPIKLVDYGITLTLNRLPIKAKNVGRIFIEDLNRKRGKRIGNALMVKDFTPPKPVIQKPKRQLSETSVLNLQTLQNIHNIVSELGEEIEICEPSLYNFVMPKVKPYEKSDKPNRESRSAMPENKYREFINDSTSTDIEHIRSLINYTPFRKKAIQTIEYPSGLFDSSLVSEKIGNSPFAFSTKSTPTKMFRRSVQNF